MALWINNPIKAMETDLAPLPPAQPDPAPAVEVAVGPAAQPSTVTIAARPFNVVVLEGSLYVIISAIPPVAQLLLSDQVITPRSMTGTILVGLVAGAISLKAFFSQSTSKKNNP